MTGPAGGRGDRADSSHFPRAAFSAEEGGIAHLAWKGTTGGPLAARSWGSAHGTGLPSPSLSSSRVGPVSPLRLPPPSAPNPGTVGAGQAGRDPPQGSLQLSGAGALGESLQRGEGGPVAPPLSLAMCLKLQLLWAPLPPCPQPAGARRAAFQPFLPRGRLFLPALPWEDRVPAAETRPPGMASSGAGALSPKPFSLLRLTIRGKVSGGSAHRGAHRTPCQPGLGVRAGHPLQISFTSLSAHCSWVWDSGRQTAGSIQA